MDNQSETKVNTKVEALDINIDELFDGAASATSVTVPEDTQKKPNIFSNADKVDFSFADPSNNVETASEAETPTTDKVVDSTDATTKSEDQPKDSLEDSNTIIDSLSEEPEVAEKQETRGRKKIQGITDVFTKLINDDKIVPFDDDKSLEDYTAKDWMELVEANLEERANQVRRETPKQFFESLPEELQVAARYVANGGQDLKGLFATLAQTEESKSLNIENERDQEIIIRDYLSATGYGSAEEIQEEIELWKDLGKLEQQASKFKPKLDKMQEKVVARKLEEQEMRRKQQEQASQQYMHNVYETLKEGSIGDLKLDRKTQNMLYNGLVQPNYPSVSGKNTNLLGHLLEKYQFVEPNYSLISEALWLLSDPDEYRAKIMEKGSQKAVESTVRKLKTEQASSGGRSLGINNQEEKIQTSSKRKIRGLRTERY